MLNTKEEVLQGCTISGLVVKLPATQLDRKLYCEVAKQLELIGGKWKGGKVAGFVFNEDPTELLEQIANGEKRNLKKEFQFFATPDHIADMLVDMAEIELTHLVLEPSAGQGAIVNAIVRKCNYNPELIVNCFELMDINRTFLSKIPHAFIMGSDFLTDESMGKFDRIVANPPFSKNQDIDHIRKMYDCLDNNGILVSVASKHWMTCNNKKETEFRNWLMDVGADITELDAGEFKSSGTMISSCIIKIKK